MRFVPRHTRAILVAGGIIILLAATMLAVTYLGPEYIVTSLGVRGGYAFAFLFATFGGISSITAGSFYVTVATLAAGGLDPFLLGVITGVGVTLGDVLFYLFGQTGRVALCGRPFFREKINRLSMWIHRRSRWTVSFIIYLYTAFSFLPGDILAVALALTQYPIKHTLIPLYLGNATLITIIALLARYGAG